MAFHTRDLSVLAYANGFTLWHYTTSDADFAPGYFNGASAMLRAGDIILANTRAGGRPSAAMLVVAGNDSGEVSITGLGGPDHA